MKYIASCSFGKDSLAAIIVAEEHGHHIDEAVYCRVMFDDKISAEFPEHEEFIYGKAIPMLESRYGIKTNIVQAKRTYCDCFSKIYQKGKRVGRIWGWPTLWKPWCNGMLKLKPIEAWEKNTEEHVHVVGIAADEGKRIERQRAKGTFMPLVEYGVTETEAFEICRRADLLSPAYNNGRERLGCWFCHNQRLAELRRLRKEYPELWSRLLELDTVSPVRFKPTSTLKQLDDRFADENAQISILEYLDECAGLGRTKND